MICEAAAVSAACVIVDGFNASHPYVCNVAGDAGSPIFIPSGLIRPGTDHRRERHRWVDVSGGRGGCAIFQAVEGLNNRLDGVAGFGIARAVGRQMASPGWRNTQRRHKQGEGHE
jgi:hypothetical protein